MCCSCFGHCPTSRALSSLLALPCLVLIVGCPNRLTCYQHSRPEPHCRPCCPCSTFSSVKVVALPCLLLSIQHKSVSHAACPLSDLDCILAQLFELQSCRISASVQPASMLPGVKPNTLAFAPIPPFVLHSPNLHQLPLVQFRLCSFGVHLFLAPFPFLVALTRYSFSRLLKFFGREREREI